MPELQHANNVGIIKKINCTFKMHPDDIKRLKDQANIEQRTKTAIIETALKQYYSRRRK